VREEHITPGGEVVLYEAPDGRVRLDVRVERDTVWLSLSQMAELFGRDKSVVSRHLRNVFLSGELEREAVVAKTATTAVDGKTYQIEYFNLDAILSVGYRVNSKRGAPAPHRSADPSIPVPSPSGRGRGEGPTRHHRPGCRVVPPSRPLFLFLPLP
jgi:hypothetical protein